ncbi:MAG: hypothetical protein EOL86_05615 [Deltaproteobacteria bacterium]|nr:hypothetical protein [Deltaproteobacteria bacterium]
MNVAELWSSLGYPLMKLVALVSMGLFIGNLIEALHWTRFVARLAQPLARIGRLCDISAASFAVAFVSGVTANTMLAEAYDQGRLTRRELILSNLFNSVPTYFLHLPSMIFITAPILKSAAFVYLGITVGSAVVRTVSILVVGRLLLHGLDRCHAVDMPQGETVTWRAVLDKTWKRFRRRIRKIISLTVPIYIGVYFMHAFGLFALAEQFLARYLGGVSWLHPKAMGIIVFQLAAEFSAGMAAAGALLDSGSMSVRDVVLALVVGNVLSSPMRAFRHQFPYYAGIYKPVLALELIVCSQGFRVASLVACTVLYAAFV